MFETFITKFNKQLEHSLLLSNKMSNFFNITTNKDSLKLYFKETISKSEFTNEIDFNINSTLYKPISIIITLPISKLNLMQDFNYYIEKIHQLFYSEILRQVLWGRGYLINELEGIFSNSNIPNVIFQTVTASGLTLSQIFTQIGSFQFNKFFAFERECIGWIASNRQMDFDFLRTIAEGKNYKDIYTSFSPITALGMRVLETEHIKSPNEIEQDDFILAGGDFKHNYILNYVSNTTTITEHEHFTKNILTLRCEFILYGGIIDAKKFVKVQNAAVNPLLGGNYPYTLPMPFEFPPKQP